MEAWKKIVAVVGTGSVSIVGCTEGVMRPPIVPPDSACGIYGAAPVSALSETQGQQAGDESFITGFDASDGKVSGWTPVVQGIPGIVTVANELCGENFTWEVQYPDYRCQIKVTGTGDTSNCDTD